MNRILPEFILSKTAKATKEGYIGSIEINYFFVWLLFKSLLQNSITNLFYNTGYKIKMWAITDNENNYNFYIQRYKLWG